MAASCDVLVSVFRSCWGRKVAVSLQELRQTIPAPRCSVGPEVLLGTAKADVDLVGLSKKSLEVDLHQELRRFSFDEETALVTLSQVAGCDLTLPKRFVKVVYLECAHGLGAAACSHEAA